MPCSPPLSLDAFPAWACLYDVAISGIELRHVNGKGCGFVLSTELRAGRDEPATLLRIPRDLVLSREAVHEYAKVDSSFKQLLEAVGPKSVRLDVMLYLLCHLVRSRRAQVPVRFTSTPWTEYVRFLPRSLTIPTLWSDAERVLLKGTSLEAALEDKRAALAKEFDELRAVTEAMPSWNVIFWEHGVVSLGDWVLVDGWYRSRCLELPDIGEAMVPGLDMTNHAASPLAYYEVNGNADVMLLVPSDCAAPCGQEVFISYGKNKSAAEMLFSYGFIDGDSTIRSLELPLDPFPDDPLAQAKVRIFGAPRTLRLAQDDQGLVWQSPFVHLMCLNEEDGLEFRVLQDTDGQRQLRLLWQGDDVTDRVGDIEALTRDHPLGRVFRLRAVVVLLERVEMQLARVRDSPLDDESRPLIAGEPLREECVLAARALRVAERSVLEAVAEALENEKSTLAAAEDVLAYLRSTEYSRADEAPEEEEDDFS